jgi:hypothetical protein
MYWSNFVQFQVMMYKFCVFKFNKKNTGLDK